MSAADKIYRDGEGRIISYPSNADPQTHFEVQLARNEERLGNIESKTDNLRASQERANESIDHIKEKLSGLAADQREFINEVRLGFKKQSEIDNQINCKPGGLVCRVESAENGLHSIFGGIKTGVWIIGILITLSGVAFGVIKYIESKAVQNNHSIESGGHHEER